MHVRLQEELIDLDEAKNRLEVELESMHHRQEEIKVELIEFDNFDSLKQQLMQHQTVKLKNQVFD